MPTRPTLRQAATGPLSEGRGRRIVKIVGLQVALPLAILAIAFATAPARAKDDATAVSKQALEAKIKYCEVCHGQSGQGFQGYYPIPRLAGQQPEYIKNQLEAFDERRRVNPIMFNVAHVLSPEMQTALATDFNKLNPKPFGGGQKDLVVTGKRIFEEGIANTDVPPCASCHGPEAKGDGQFPRLAGQLPDYVFKKLTNWSKERGQDPAKPDTSAIMEPIAHGLTEPQIKAVAAYLSYLQ
jgi:cytochrome c553